MKKVYSLLILVIVFSIVLVGATSMEPLMAGPTTFAFFQKGCIDTDGGQDFSTKGTVNGLDPQNIRIEREDYCENTLQVVEFFCSDKYVTQTYHNCMYGCNDGACNSPAAQVAGCTDSDGGDTLTEHYTKGTVTDIAGNTGIDHCMNEWGLKEYYCLPDNTIMNKNIVCGDGCESGACLQITIPVEEEPETVGVDEKILDALEEKEESTYTPTEIQTEQVSCTDDSNCPGDLHCAGSVCYACSDSDSTQDIEDDFFQVFYKGTTTGVNVHGDYKETVDECLSASTVYEQYCGSISNVEGYLRSQYVECGNNNICLEGKCEFDDRQCADGIDIVAGVTCCDDDDCDPGELCGYSENYHLLRNGPYGGCYSCNDPEGGIYIHKNLPISGVDEHGQYLQDVLDSCISDPTRVQEFYCSDNKVVSTDLPCPDGETCVNGECVASRGILKAIFSKRDTDKTTVGEAELPAEDSITEKGSLLQRVRDRFQKKN